MDAFITYEGLPKGAHILTKKGFEKAYIETQSFLESFTNGQSPASIYLIFYSAQDGSYRTLPHIWKLARKFGIPKYECWNLISVKQRVFTWQIHVSQLDFCMNLLKEYETLPPNPFGPLTLALSFPFRFVDPITNEIIPNQEKIPQLDFRMYNSHLHLRLGQNTSLFAWLAFPFENFDDEAGIYINSAMKSLPFKPSPNGWRRWTKTKRGTWKSEIIKMGAS